MKQFLNKYKSIPIQAKAGIWFFVCNIIQKGIGFITTPIFTRLMSTEQYGIFTTYQTWRDILCIFITFSLSGSVYMKKMIELDTQEERNKLTCSLQGLTVFITLTVLSVYLLFMSLWNKLLNLPTMAVLTIFISSLLTAAYDFWGARARIDYKYRALIAVTLLSSLLKPIFAIIAIKHTTETAFARIYAVTGVEVLIYSVLFFTNIKSGEKWYNKEYWKYGMIFVLPLIPHFLSQRILSSSDRIMIERMIGVSETGIYGLANSIGAILMIVVTSCDGVLAPWIYSRIKENKNNNDTVRRISLYIVIMMAILSLGVIVIGPELIRFFAPQEYYEAIWVLPPLILSIFLMLIYMFFIFYEYYFEETKKIMFATMGSAAINIGLNYIFIPQYGYIAAGYTTLFCYIVYAGFHYLVYRRTCQKHGITDMPYNAKLFLFIFVISLILGISATTIYNYPLIRYLIVLVIVIATIMKRKWIMGIIHQIRKA